MALQIRGCTCCGDLLTSRLDRRHFLLGAGAAGLAAALTPRMAFSATGHYEAMVLGCIDPRLQDPMYKYLAGRGLTGKYSQFIIAGAAIGVVAEPFKDWHKAFWDNLATSVQLHNIKSVIVINHRDCGAAKIAYGEAKVATPEIETETHKASLKEFRRQLSQKSNLGVETGLMGIDGKIEMYS
jgi:carbonic anhydrase